jgi:cell division initiation protein
MKLTPINIKTQEFTKTIRGFDSAEVMAYLEKLAAEVEELLTENESLKKEVKDLKTSVDEFKKIEKNLQNSLLSAQDSSTKSIESTRKQTSVMVKESELKALQIIEKAKESANQIRDAVLTLREEKDLIISKLKVIVNTQANLLEEKVQQVDTEPEKPKKQESKDNLDVDVDKIVNKLL